MQLFVQLERSWPISQRTQAQALLEQAPAERRFSGDTSLHQSTPLREAGFCWATSETQASLRILTVDSTLLLVGLRGILGSDQPAKKRSRPRPMRIGRSDPTCMA